MRIFVPLICTVLIALTGCERFEAPDRSASIVLQADVTVVIAPGGETVAFVRNRGPRDDGPAPAVFQGGRLTLRGGCLLFNDHLVVWPNETRLDLSKPGAIHITDRG